MKTIMQLFAGLLLVVVTGSYAFSAGIPVDDRDLFSHLFAEKSIPVEWISPPAAEELTPTMMADIAARLLSEGGRYEKASKSAKGWVLEFKNGTARARIVRARDNRLIGVSFSKLK